MNGKWYQNEKYAIKLCITDNNVKLSIFACPLCCDYFQVSDSQPVAVNILSGKIYQLSTSFRLFFALCIVHFNFKQTYLCTHTYGMHRWYQTMALYSCSMQFSVVIIINNTELKVRSGQKYYRHRIPTSKGSQIKEFLHEFILSTLHMASTLRDTQGQHIARSSISELVWSVDRPLRTFIFADNLIVLHKNMPTASLAWRSNLDARMYSHILALVFISSIFSILTQ